MKAARGTPARAAAGTALLVTTLVVILAGCARPGGASADGFAARLDAVRSGRSHSLVADRPLTDAEWEALRGLAGLRELVLEHGRADDSRAAILATLSDLERLVLRESPLGDKGFRRLAGLGRLRDLNVPQAACTAEGIRALAALPALRVLRLGGPSLSGRDVSRPGVSGPDICRAVAALPGLRSLHLIDVPIGDEGLGVLAGLPGLWNLYLDGAGVSDEAWGRYFQKRPDVHVHVDQAHHDRDPNSHDP